MQYAYLYPPYCESKKKKRQTESEREREHEGMEGCISINEIYVMPYLANVIDQQFQYNSNQIYLDILDGERGREGRREKIFSNAGELKSIFLLLLITVSPQLH